MELFMESHNSQRKEAVSAELLSLIRRAVSETLDYEGYDDDFAVSVTLVSNSGIRRYNREYRGIDRPTDVLSFPMADGDLSDAFDGEKYQLGDIVLSLEKAREQSELYGHSFEREVAFLTVHSTLHLLGYDHETGEEDEEDMRRRQREIMKKMQLEVKE
jgi:probable rRNA maturation factor